MDQVQCLNCGGFRVKRANTYRFDPRTGKAWNRAGCLTLLIVFVPLAFTAAAMVLGERAVENFGEKPDLVFSAVGVAVAAGVVVSVAIVLFMSAGQTTVGAASYSCELCGYEFFLRDDEPRPRVTPRPDLIERGYRRMKEQEEEEHRRLFD